MTAEEFVQHKNKIRQELYKHGTNTSRYKTIKQARGYINKEFDDAIMHSELKQYFYEPVATEHYPKENLHKTLFNKRKTVTLP